MTSLPRALLSLTDYAAGYERAPVFASVNVQLNPGDVLLVTGENGSGKSTLLKGVAGLTPIETGRADLLAHDLTSADPWKRVALGVVYVSQTGGLFDHLSIAENLRLAASITGNSDGSRSVAAVEFIGNLRSQMERPVGRLSGGERRLVALARASVTNARVFLLDEPLAGIAHERRAELVEKVVSLVKQTNACALWVEHLAPDLAMRSSGELRLDPSN